VQKEEPAIDILPEPHVLQFAKLERPSVPENLPAGHWWQEEISVDVSVSDHVPMGHLLQVMVSGNIAYVPRGHDSHWLQPGPAENLPTGHILQDKMSMTATVSDAIPAGHMIQVFMFTASANSEYVPARHDTHVVGPAIFVYLPVARILQTKISVAATVLDAFPAGHMLQVLDWDNSEYVPVRHDAHVFSPDIAENLPAGHWLQL